MRNGAVEEKVGSNKGVQGSNPGRACPVCEIFRMAKTDGFYVKIPTKTDQNDKKKLKGFDQFWQNKKATKTDDFLCLNPKNFSTREVLKFSDLCSVLLVFTAFLRVSTKLEQNEDFFCFLNYFFQ